ncbi:MAG: hypothetical protein GY822_04000 [Deltaproteobacteria bacterium]|nr:hypothetical protein [Deltaproteobacteria bacterium]
MAAFPAPYDLSETNKLQRTLVNYMLQRSVGVVVTEEDLFAAGEMGDAIRQRFRPDKENLICRCCDEDFTISTCAHDRFQPHWKTSKVALETSLNGLSTRSNAALRRICLA